MGIGILLVSLLNIEDVHLLSFPNLNHDSIIIVNKIKNNVLSRKYHNVLNKILDITLTPKPEERKSLSEIYDMLQILKMKSWTNIQNEKSK